MPLRLTTASGRADLAIDIPPVNVLDVAVLEEFARLVLHAGGERVLVLSGLPRAFSAGVSVAEHVPDPRAIESMLAAMRGALNALVKTPAVTIAAVAGACLGGGAELAAACDVVIVREDARIGFPEIRLACFPPGAAALLPIRIGGARAADWILTGRTVSGREAAQVGFASRAVSPANLEKETALFADQLLSTSPAALAGARDLLRAERRRALAEALPHAEDAYRMLAGNEDLARAVEDFQRGTRDTGRRTKSREIGED
ncbi:MAG TPA: enoyl-CoA hydratase/isomerase family protein [Thermoanaerobaculia bacterium]